jgi:NAD(P)-dependent dehydrogenase (short-subunit alcohol dehydrogenase family)
VTWDKVEGWMKDWEAFADGGEAKDKWVPLDQGMIAFKYCVSKAVLNPWLRKYAAAHPEVRFAAVCPGYCATDLNHFQGFRSASAGGESIVWPLLNEFESGKFYQDGKAMAYAQDLPDWAKTDKAGRE